MGIKNEIRMETWLNQVVRTILLILTVLCIGTAIMGGCGRFQGGWNSFAVIAGLLVVIVLLMLASNKTKQYFRVWLVIIFFVALLARLIPVSYTHLDVYKRQVSYRHVHLQRLGDGNRSIIF